MCGISGFIDAAASMEDLQRIHDAQSHRGPDSNGFYFESPVGLAHNRLSIIDLSARADQPMIFEHLVIIFNGEIYNYKEVRSQLIEHGYSFTTESDTEVLIKGFHCWGKNLMSKLIGMFAIAIYNKRDERLYLIRDRIGVKPLYYFFDGKVLYFFSELKAWLSTSKMINIDEQALNEFLKFGYVVSNRSIIQKVSKVPPGCCLELSAGRISVTQYWNLLDYAFNEKWQTNEEQTADNLEELLISSFKYRMIADVPVGIFFSGGIDSTLLVALLSKHHGRVNTFTIGFREDAYNEAPYAKKIAQHFRTSHSEHLLTREDAEQRLSSFYKIYDEPFYDSSGIPTSLVSELAKQKGMKVVLSSEGGDELFSGYPSYQSTANRGKNIFSIPNSIRFLTSTLLSNATRVLPYNKAIQVSRAARLLKAQTWTDFYIENNSTLDEQIGLLSSLNASIDLEAGVRNKRAKPEEIFMIWDLLYLMPNDFLVKIDRATMFHGLECREPFLDHRLIEFCLRIPFHMKFRDGRPKYLLRKILSRYLPNALYDRPKMGFSIPLFSWFRENLDKMLYQQLNHSTFTKAWPMIDYRLIERELNDYKKSSKSGNEKNMLLLWKFLNLMLWKRAYGIEQ